MVNGQKTIWSMVNKNSWSCPIENHSFWELVTKPSFLTKGWLCHAMQWLMAKTLRKAAHKPHVCQAMVNGHWSRIMDVKKLKITGSWNYWPNPPSLIKGCCVNGHERQVWTKEAIDHHQWVSLTFKWSLAGQGRPNSLQHVYKVCIKCLCRVFQYHQSGHRLTY